jgi:hypothetical protein
MALSPFDSWAASVAPPYPLQGATATAYRHYAISEAKYPYAVGEREGNKMNSLSSGWMWFDNDPARSIEEKIQQAAQHYHTKFGRFPNTCYVNQRAIDIDGDGRQMGEIKVVGMKNILPHHFLFTKEEQHENIQE